MMPHCMGAILANWLLTQIAFASSSSVIVAIIEHDAQIRTGSEERPAAQGFSQAAARMPRSQGTGCLLSESANTRAACPPQRQACG